MIVNVYASVSIPAAPAAAVKIVSVNNNRQALMIYNNSANTIYCKFGSPGTGSDLSFTIPTYTAYTVPVLWTGEIYATRNSGSGVAVVSDFSSGV